MGTSFALVCTTGTGGFYGNHYSETCSYGTGVIAGGSGTHYSGLGFNAAVYCNTYETYNGTGWWDRVIPASSTALMIIKY